LRVMAEVDAAEAAGAEDAPHLVSAEPLGQCPTGIGRRRLPPPAPRIGGFFCGPPGLLPPVPRGARPLATRDHAARRRGGAGAGRRRWGLRAFGLPRLRLRQQPGLGGEEGGHSFEDASGVRRLLGTSVGAGRRGWERSYTAGELLQPTLAGGAASHVGLK